MTNTPETMALAPCPFCGGEAVDVDTSEICCPIEYNAHARCSDCDAQGPGEYRWDTTNEAKAEAIAAWNRRADTRPAPVSVTKPLEWGGAGTWGNQPSYHADSAFGWLMIVDHTQHGNGFRVYPPWEETKESHPTLEAAKAAAQADYNARILSALHPAPAVEGLRRALFEIGGMPGTEAGTIKARRIAAAALAAYEESRK